MVASHHEPGLELWGGVECTVNRVGDRYRDQTLLNGHQHRHGDLDLFAGLGLSALRYPVLWERTAPDPARAPDWSWPDARLARLRALGIRPIVGLVHHGSGPRHTDLLDEGFATGLGDYAGKVAARYPWVEDWTPVNEPLTTARFSALYGHWYPHRRDPRSFWLALLNQVDGTRAAMHAIRRINPAARLIATDDLGRTYATPPLAGQAAFDNIRRWAGWDLLFGRVTRDHPLRTRLERLGLGDRVRRIADDPCPPDVIGLNHYLTSDRFLDHRLDRYPAHLHGGNGALAYADTEAVRVLNPPGGGLGTALRETWARYGTPIAITEVHNGSTREEQMRWAAEAWDTAVTVRREGVDVRAVTAWALLGSHGWNTLLTGDGEYEPGVFDVGVGGAPRPTALAALWRGLPHGAPRHPVVQEPGWWRRDTRLLYPQRAAATDAVPGAVGAGSLLIRDADTPLGQRFAAACAVRGLRHVHADVAPGPSRGTSCWAVVDLRPAAPDGPRACGKPGCHPQDGIGSIALKGLRCTVLLAGDPDAAAVDTLVGVALDLLIDGATGVWHVARDQGFHACTDADARRPADADAAVEALLDAAE